MIIKQADDNALLGRIFSEDEKTLGPGDAEDFEVSIPNTGDFFVGYKVNGDKKVFMLSQDIPGGSASIRFYNSEIADSVKVRLFCRIP